MSAPVKPGQQKVEDEDMPLPAGKAASSRRASEIKNSKAEHAVPRAATNSA